MAATGSPESKLIVLRGNSGSGKSSTARLLRERLGRRTAWVEQDQIRRILLWERDRPGSQTLTRHASRELAKVVGSEAMRSWYQELDVLSGVGEEIIDRHSTLEQTVERILADLGWKPGDTRELVD